MASFSFNPNAIIKHPITQQQASQQKIQQKERQHAAIMAGSALLTGALHLAQNGVPPPVYCAMGIVGSGIMVTHSSNIIANNITKNK